MALFDFLKRSRPTEARASVEDPQVPISSANILEVFGLEAGKTVTVEAALGVPAVFSAVNFIAGTIAGLPCHVYKRSKNGRVRVDDDLAGILHDAVNDEWSSFAWRKYTFDQVLTGGRGATFIERNTRGRVVNLWPLDPSGLTVKRKDGLRSYEYKDGSRRKFTYESSEVIDLTFMLRSDQIRHRSPISQCREAIGQAIALATYGTKFFNGGGVPPFVIEGPFKSPAGLQNAANNLAEAVAKAKNENRLALAIPAGHTIKPIGADPEKSQMVEAQRFMIEQVARIYSLPPVFLQDLTHGTFSNSEQQDLHFVKHTLKRWIEQFEQELNLKLFGRARQAFYVEFNLDGLLRGDFKTRMEGYASGIQHGVLKPNEARAAENRADYDGGDQAFMQGAMVPVARLTADADKGTGNGN